MDFPGLLKEFTGTFEREEPEAFASLFAPDAVYHDPAMGDFKGRDEIAAFVRGFLENGGTDVHWEMSSSVHEGPLAFAQFVFSYTSTAPGSEGKRIAFEGMSRFEFDGGLIRDYREVYDVGIAVRQTGADQEAIAKIADRHIDEIAARYKGTAHLPG